MFVQRRLNVSDVDPTLYKCYTNVLCLLGSGWCLSIIVNRMIESWLHWIWCTDKRITFNERLKAPCSPQTYSAQCHTSLAHVQIQETWNIYADAISMLKVIYHPLYGMNNYVLIWVDWLSCDPLRGSHDSQSPHIWRWLAIMWPSQRVTW